MEQHVNLTEEEFEQQFEHCTLDPAVFSHEAHLRLAWIHITKYGKQTAIEHVCTQLQAFVRSVGAEEKYNHTLTIAAIHAADHFIRKSNADNFIDFITEFPRLKTSFKELMAFHYQTDIFNSEKAKKEFLEPDLLPFDK